MHLTGAVLPFGLLWRPGDRVQRTRLRGAVLVTYVWPGLWMDSAELDGLRADLENIAQDRLNALPDYGVFLSGRAAYENRIVTVLYRGEPRRAVAFSAMVHCPVRIGNRTEDVINLGLAITRRADDQGERLASLYVRPLFQYYLRRRMRPFWIATFTSKPRAVGSVADAFSEVYPHYRHDRPPTAAHVDLARAFFDRWRGESGVAPVAVLDTDSFVVRASSAPGPSGLLLRQFAELAKYRVPAANEFCSRRLDYVRGDDFLMIGKMDVRTALRAVSGRLGPPA